LSDQGQLYLRKWNVTIASATAGLDLSELHIKFKINQSDLQTPNNARIRIYNLSQDRSSQLLGKEFDRVVVSAGYVNGPYGVIFDGQIKQTLRGKESQIDTFLDIYAAEGDEAYNYSISAGSLAAGSTLKQRIDAYAKSMGLEVGYISIGLAVNPSALARGAVFFGLSKNYLRQEAIANNARWSIQNGKLVFISNSDYIQAEPIVLSPASGLIGIPTQTQAGISAKALLNPNFTIGQPVKIDSTLINAAPTDSFFTLRSPTQIQPGPNGSAKDNALAFTTLSPIAGAGLYRVVVSEYEGDTRGNDWYSDLICFAISPDVTPGSAVSSWPGATTSPP